jgi:hypothetical protein
MATHDPKLDPDSVLQFLKEAHNDLLKDGLWKPANRPRDTGAVPSALVSIPGSKSSDQKSSDGEGRLTKALKVRLQLDQASLSSKKDGKKTPENSPCNICGKLGHWGPKCPDENKSLASSSNGSSSGHPSTSRTGNRSWKRTPPGPSGPQTKKVNMTNFFWCAKCNRWSTSHGTDQHKKKESQAINQSASLAIDPSVWLVTDHEIIHESSGLTSGFLASVVVFVAMLGMFWLFNCGYNSRVVGSSVGFTHAFMSLAKQFSSDQMNSKVMVLGTMAKQLFNYDVVHIGKSIVAFLCSLQDVICTILCHSKQLSLSVFAAPCLWLGSLLLLVIKDPSKISKSVFNSKEVKMKRSVC